jgi:uncharacterized alpha/beta hydrolase family protein
MNSEIKSPKIRKKFFLRIFVISIAASSLILINCASLFPLANAQPICANETITTSPQSTTVLPVILIHGYNEGPLVWSTWENLLEDNGIPFCTVEFSYDQCGSASDHANELGQIVEYVKSNTQQSHVNMVGHSKGGLDARVYLDTSGTADVANLIMIGTPNAGDPLANKGARNTAFDFLNLSCTPALYDLEVGADDTKAYENHNTKYYTIAGDWNPSLESNCPQQWSQELMWFGMLGFEDKLYAELIDMNAGLNDGIVPITSVESLPYSTSLGHTQDCHTNLLNNEEFTRTQPYLVGLR